MTNRSRTSPLLALACLAGLALPFTFTAPTLAQPAPAPAGAPNKPDNLDIKRITLYRSGVGSFLRQGTVDGDASVQLRFKTDQVNDILKSMIVLDLSGGQIEGVSYASKEPLAKRLASFGVDISDQPDLPTLLGKLRGAVASVTGPEGAVTGTILGVEYREQAAGNAQQPIKVPFLNLVTGGGIRSIDLTKAGAVDLQDKELAGELAKALTALAEHRADRTKAVEVALRGAGARNIVVGYIHEMPVWKASYRMVLPDEKAQDKADKKDGTKDLKKGELSLQGWAIVENPTDEDWKDVTLSLVSGRPVSFQMDLYEPLFVTRPEVPVPTVPGVAPRMYAGGVAMQPPPPTAGAPAAMRMRDAPSPANEPAARKPGSPGGRPRGGGGGGEGASAGEESRALRELDADGLTSYSAAARAQAVESGEVFQYELKTPVTIERQRSAMLPIVNQGVQGRRVSIFNRADGSEHPMRGLEVKNTTDLQLLPGPISVYDGSAYAGDAQIGHVAPGDKRLLSYAVDLDVAAITKDESTTDVRKLRIVGGLIEQTNLTVNKITYQFSNKSLKHDRTIIVEHPKLAGHELKSEAKPAEETQGLYRFEVAVAPEKQGSLTVMQERTYAQQVQLLSYDLGTFAAYRTQGKLSQAVLDAFREGQRKQVEIQNQQTEIERLDRERNEITQDQARVRENMKAIDKGTDLYSTYIKKFADQEKRVGEITEQLKTQRQRLTDLQTAFASWLGGLNVD